jgi:hypothetical protein
MTAFPRPPPRPPVTAADTAAKALAAAARAQAAKEAAERRKSKQLAVRAGIVLAIAALGWSRLRRCGARGALAKAAGFYVVAALAELAFRKATERLAMVLVLRYLLTGDKKQQAAAGGKILALALGPYAAMLVAVLALTRCR